MIKHRTEETIDMRQVVAYKRLKMMENYKTVRPKSVHNHLRQVVAHGSSTVLLGSNSSSSPFWETHKL